MWTGTAIKFSPCPGANSEYWANHEGSVQRSRHLLKIPDGFLFSAGENLEVGIEDLCVQLNKNKNKNSDWVHVVGENLPTPWVPSLPAVYHQATSLGYLFGEYIFTSPKSGVSMAGLNSLHVKKGTLSHFCSNKFTFVRIPHWPQVMRVICFCQSLFLSTFQDTLNRHFEI